MNLGSFSLRPGRGWLENPALHTAVVDSPAFSSRRGVRTAPEEILDVIHLEVDGVDLTADLGESCLPEVLESLGRAAELLATGEQTAVVPFGSPTCELVFARSGPKVLISLIVPQPFPELRLDDLELETLHLLDEVQAMVQVFLDDLEAVGLIEERGLLSLAERLSRSRYPVESEAPPVSTDPAIPAQPARIVRTHSPLGNVECVVELAGSLGRLATPSGGPDLHSLLRKGRISLVNGCGGEIAAWSGPPFLAFRFLVAEMRDILVQWAGAEELELRLGSSTIGLNRRDGKLQGPKQSYGAEPLEAVIAFLDAGSRLCDLLAPLHEPPAGNAYLEELEGEISELRDLCLELMEGDDLGPPPEPQAAARGSRPPTLSRRPLCPWKLRKVNITQKWSFDAGALLQGGFGLVGKGLLVAGEFGAQALELEGGRPIWTREEVDAVWLGPGRGAPVVLSTTLGLEMITPLGSTAWSCEPLEAAIGSEDGYLRGPGRLIFRPDGRTATALAESDGSTCWRYDPPGGRFGRLGGGPAGVLVASDAGFLHAIDADSGRRRWRIRTDLRPLADPVCAFGHVLLFGESATGCALLTADASTGRGAATVPLPVQRVGRPISAAGRLVLPVFGNDTGAIVFVGPDLRPALLHIDDLSGRPAILPDRQRVLAVDGEGSIVCLGPAGGRIWSSRLPFESSSARPLLAAARGLLLVGHHDALHVVDMEDGKVLGCRRAEGMTEISKLCTGRDLDVYLGDPEGTILACRVGTRMALVT
ncbi:MAG: PQQ-binding-like beta-propeller repeat protein [Myxococcota bacterium]